MRVCRFLLAVLLSSCPPVFCASPAAEEASTLWQTLSQPAFDPAKTADIQKVTLVRDRIRIQLEEGRIQFAKPAAGRVFGAVFEGRGRVQVQPPSPIEAQQLWLFTGKLSLDLEFTEAVFSFSDNTFDELATQVQWTSSAADLSDIYIRRQNEREDVGAEILPRLFKSLLSADRKRTAFFLADLKTAGKGWVQVSFDALDPEEVTVGRWVPWLRTTRFEIWLSFPANGLSPSEAYRDPLAKEDVEVSGYRIAASVGDSAELHATTEVNLRHRIDAERVLVFGLDSNLRVQGVRDIQGSALPFFQPRDPKDRDQSYGDYLAVVLPQPAHAGETQTLEFQYAGKRVIRKVGSGNFFCQSYGWYPARANSFVVRAAFEMNFRSPKKYALVATGTKVSETTDGDWLITTWKSELPLAVAGFAFGDYKVYQEKAGTVDIQIYANRNPDDFMESIRLFANEPGVMGLSLGTLSPAALVKPMATEVANTVRLFEMYFGPFPYSRLAVSNIPYSYGQGWPMLLYLSALSFLDSTQRNSLGITDHIGISDFFRAHESSHQWWGHRVGWKSYHDQWLSEGFAQFSGNLYVQFRENMKEYLNRLRKDREELLKGRDDRNRVYESLGPVWMGRRLASRGAPRAYSLIVYNKGGYVLHMLRMLLFDPNDKENPERRFMTMMQDFTHTYHNQAASTEDFKAIVEKHMTAGMDLEGSHRMDWFFRQYVYGTGIPHYEFRYQVQDAGGGNWRVSGTVIQTGVPQGWKDLLPVYLKQSGHTLRLGWIRATQKESPFDFTLPIKPEKLVLNANEDILAEIKQ